MICLIFTVRILLSKGFYSDPDDLKLKEGWVIVPQGGLDKIQANIDSSSFGDFLSGRLQQL
jgi:hypothetical protein